MQFPIILGVDPGLRITGYGVLEATPGKPKLREAGVLRTDETKESSLACRIQILYKGIEEVLEQYRPTALAVEQLYAHYAHPRTAILMGHARGVLLLAGAMRGVDVVHYAATRIKKVITGNGRASKEQIQLTIQRELGLAKLPEPADVADALAVALCHYYLNQHKGV